MNEPPKVALVNQPWGHIEPPVVAGGSIPIILYELASRFTGRAKVLYYTRGRFRPARKTVEQIEYHYLPVAPDKAIFKLLDRLPGGAHPLKPRWASSLAYYTYGLQLALSLREQRADVVHLVNMSQFLPIVRRFNPDAVIAIHMQCEWLSQLDRAMIAERLRCADLILGCSDFITDRVRQRFPEFAHRCHTLYNGVDTARFQQRPAPPAGAPARKVAFVGRISPEKGVHVLVEAFARIAARHADVTLEIVGPDEINPPSLVVPLTDDAKVHELLPWYSTPAYRAALDRLITPEIRPRVLFRGNLPHGPALASAYSDADLSVVPSVWDEPFGMPVTEGMACGIPVIATRGGAFPEIITDGEDGVLVDKGDVGQLAAALDRLLGDESLRRRLGAAARQRVVETFSWEKVAEQALSYFNSSRSHHDTDSDAPGIVAPASPIERATIVDPA